MIRVEDVGFAFDGFPREVLDGVSFDVAPGEVVCLMGPSGCGKSTILNILAGFLAPSRGQVTFATRESQKRQVGYIFQADALLPWRTIEKNLLLSSELRTAEGDPLARIFEYLDLFGLAKSVLTMYPSALSGGMRQRVSIIQSLLTDPTLMLLDEPFASLDIQTKLRLETDFLRLFENTNRSALFVTHDLAEAIVLADRIIVLSPAPAKVHAELVINDGPRTSRVANQRATPEFAAKLNRLWMLLNDAP